MQKFEPQGFASRPGFEIGVLNAGQFETRFVAVHQVAVDEMEEEDGHERNLPYRNYRAMNEFANARIFLLIKV